MISNKRIKHSLVFDKISIELIYKNSLLNLPIKNSVVKIGYLKVAKPELNALDLFKYSNHAGGISHIATVLSELIENLDVNNLISLAENTNESYQLQRIGYVIEQIEVMEEDKKNNFLAILLKYIENTKRRYITIVPNMPKTGASKCKKWKIIENADFESDL